MLDGILDSLKNAFSSVLMTEGGGSFTDFLGMFFNNPTKFKPANLGYNDPIAYNFTPKILKTLVDASYNIGDFRRSTPPTYYEYTSYDHRKLLTDYYVRIGDCIFTIPPDFIMVNSVSQTNKQTAIRQRNTMKTKAGYKKREVVLTLYFVGLDQINGIEVKSPFDYSYYVDGLRPLLAQFMLTPFLPIENEYLNINCGIFNVALSQFQVTTVAGFPGTLQATLMLEEMNVTPYIEASNSLYDDFIDWDLFRYYYQRLLTPLDANQSYQFHLKPVDNKYSLSGKFKIYCLNEKAVSGDFTKASGDSSNEDDKAKNQYNTDLTNDINYDLILTDDNNITINEITFALSNILPSIEMSDHDTSTYQYLGGSDVTFTLSIETTDRDVINKINYLEKTTQDIARTYREFNGIGYIKIENELLALTGTKFVMFDEIKIVTTPEQAGLFKIDIQCVSYDMGQKDREKLDKFRPFDGTADKSQAISQSMEGLFTKIKQDLYAERKMLEMELYPDLFLPTYDEINKIIPKIREFRTSNNLVQIGYEKYSPSGTIVPCEGTAATYSKYLDPDFYVFYPLKYSDLSNDVLALCNVNKAKPSTVTAPDHEFGDELPGNVKADGSIDWTSTFSSLFGSNSSGGTSGGTTNVTATGSRGKFLAFCEAQNGKRYSQDARLGPNSFDCSGLVDSALNSLGLGPYSYTHWSIYTNLCTPITKDQLKPGDLCFRYGDGASSGHVAVCDGPNSTIEAMNTANGVKHGNINSRFDHYGRINCLKDDDSSSTTTSSTPSNSTVVATSPPSATASKVTAEQLDQALNGLLKGHGNEFIEFQSKYNVDAALIAAICIHESANGTSSFCKQYNNPSGTMDPKTGCHTGMPFATMRDGIEYTFKNIRTYNNQGLTTIQQIGNQYSPIGADNDPGHLNQYWVSSVTKYYSTLTSGGTYVGVGGGSNAIAAEPAYEWKKNDNAGKKYNDKSEDYTDELAKGFGKPLYCQSPLTVTYDLSNKVTASNPPMTFKINKDAFKAFLQGNYMNTMCVDMCQYTSYGRMLRAFPTYVFMLLDDSSVWLDGRKLWTNFYIYKSLIDISIHQTEENPIQTAEINLTNIYENLSKAPSMQSMWYNIMKDNEVLGVSKEFYKYFGVMPGGAKLTDDMVKFKSQLFDHVAINPGTRIHVRLGYGSNPMGLPICFNGVIAEVNLSDVVTIVAQSDGAELLSNVLSSKQGATNNIGNLQNEPSDIVASILGDREQWFMNELNKDWFESSRFGIEHFGTPIVEGNKHEQQYDICKNVYLANYKAAQFCDPTHGPFDGEANMNFFLYNRYPWDAFQLCAQEMPEFVCQPMYHQFESRIFYGLPYWPCSYRYDINTDNKTLYEYAKSFTQIHCINSINSIIDNGIKVSCTDLKTNCIATYSRGGKLITSPVLYADRSINWDKQKTKIVDTTVMQDYAGWDWSYEKLGIKVGKNAAIRVGTSNILESFKRCYEGPLIILGDASIKPCDIIVLDDSYIQMTGNALVREATHSLGVSTGFISTITPGVIGGSTDHKSGLANIFKSLCTFGISTCMVNHVRQAGIKFLDYADDVKSSSKVAAVLDKGKDIKIIAKNYSTIAFDAIKTCDYIKDGKKLESITNAIKTLKSAGAIAGGVGKGITTVIGGVVAVVGATLSIVPLLGSLLYILLTTILINTLLDFVFDQISYNNVVNIYPLLYKNKPFIAGVNGQSKLMPAFSETPPDDKNKSVDPEKEKEEADKPQKVKATENGTAS